MFNLRAKKLYKFILTLGFGLCFFITGCQNPLDTVLDEPSMGLDNERPASYLPTNLVATHGKYREIELSWEPSDNAMRYYIYQSTTPFSNFQQIGETTADENSYTVSAKSSALFYYKVTAVTSRGEETIPSNTAMGTTLSTPVISDIVSETESGFITVKWYMENSQYYAAGSVAYSVICFDKGGAEVARSELITDAQADRATFKGLEPKTTYWFEVEVYNMSDQSKTEKSGKLDAETARRMRPAAPENLSATQGEYSEKIVISFTKPAMVDVKVGSDFKETPLDFHVERRETYPYATSFVNITDSLTDKDKLTHTGDYENYIVGETVTVADTNAHRGRRYEYRVRSYTHNTSTTTEYSMAVAEGWAVPTMVYKMSRSDYEKDANGDHKAVTLFGTLEFDAFGKDDNYSYDLSYDFYAKQTNGVFPSSPTKQNESILSGVSRAELESYKMPLVLPRDNGKYQFKVSATHKTSGWKGDVQATRSEVVSDKIVFSIQNLEVEDGYPDKFLVSWTCEENVRYLFARKKIDENGNGTDFVQDIKPIEGKNGTYTHTFKANSGDKYQFRVAAIDGESEDTDIYSTLGTPVVEFDENAAEMDKITVKWKPVEKATDYRIKYSYDINDRGSEYNSATTIRDGKAMSFNDLSEKDQYLYEADARAEYIHTFEKPAGYDNMLFAGRPMIVTVEAINEERNNVSTIGQNTNARVLGPYLATNGATASVAKEPDIITYSWKKVPGAKGYYISRIRYNVSNNPAEENTIKESDADIVYYYDVSKNKIYMQGNGIERSDKHNATITPNGENFILEDKFALQSTDTTSRYYQEQDRLAWGYPFRYQVFPVTEDTGFERTSEEKCILGDKVTYIDTTKVQNYKTGSALGWGIDVTASKATSGTDVDLNWAKPYTKGATNVKPTIWYRHYNSTSDSDWKELRVSSLNDNTHSYSRKRANDQTDFQAFDYVVKYTKGSTPSSIQPKPSYIDDRKVENNEAKNKGYFFSIDINTDRVPGQDPFEERLEITSWDYDERKLGPESYTISLKNKNYSEKWQKIADIGNPTDFSSIQWDFVFSTGFPAVNGKPTKRQENNAIYLMPTFDVNNTHNGYLKVLRDYKHYYKVTATRKDGAETVETEQEAFASRQVTLEELTKIAIIGISTGMDATRGGRKSGENGINVTDSFGGSVSSDATNNLRHDFKTYTAEHEPKFFKEEGKVYAIKISGYLMGKYKLNSLPSSYWSDGAWPSGQNLIITYYGYDTNNTAEMFFHYEVKRDNGLISIKRGSEETKFKGSGGVYYYAPNGNINWNRGLFRLPFRESGDNDTFHSNDDNWK